ncbi:MAG TPA: SHOCT domain-containing protein [Stellaceae bacterium]|jgi:hypothetical protein|nr:SHOCT domain-containing protein [Stellaceae bacterium]
MPLTMPPGMPARMPTVPETLTYAVVAAVVLAILTALVLAATGAHDLVAAVLVLAVGGAVYWCIGRNLATLVTGKEAAGAGAALLAICALAELAAGWPYQGVLFLLDAAALGVVLLLLQQGATPLELRFGGLVAVAPPGTLIHLRMLKELHDAGILTDAEYAEAQIRVGTTGEPLA